MTNLHHLNCGLLHAPPNPRAACHCLLLETDEELALVDSGIGMLDVADPGQRIGKPLIEIAGFQFDEAKTAIRQIERLGFQAEAVKHIFLTHGDPDHTGGLADFPNATVHVSKEEFNRIQMKQGRYLFQHFTHGVNWRTYSVSTQTWFGLEARTVVADLGTQVHLIPLFGHTLGHCGVAVQHGESWTLHVGDAYYLRAELTNEDHPVSTLAAQRADDNILRQQSLTLLRRLAKDHPEIQLFGYHDFSEFPSARSMSG